MKIEVTSLTDLYLVLDKIVDERKMPEKQKPKWKRILKLLAKDAHDLGKNGKAEIEI